MKFSRTGLVALAVVAGLAAGCGGSGGDVKKDDVAAKLKTEKDISGLPPATYDCMAGVMMKDAKKDDLKKYVDGKMNADSIKATKSDADLKKDMAKCDTSR